MSYLVSRMLLPRLVAVAWIPLSGGCDSAPTPSPEAGQGPAGASEAEVLARLEAEPDPIHRLAVLRELARDPSAQLAPICEKLGDSSLSSECESLARRAHLRSAQPPPGLQGVDTRPVARGPLAGVTPSPDPACAELEPDARDACQSLSARDLAQAGHVEEAAARCGAKAEGRDECLFRAAEIRIREHDGADAAALCLASAQWTAQCLAHLVRDLSSPVPYLLPPMAGDWQALAVQIEMAARVAGAAPGVQEESLRERFWAHAFLYGMQYTTEVDGSVLEALPLEARPQFTATLAWRLASGDPDLDSLVARVLAGSQGPIALGEDFPSGGEGGMDSYWPTPSAEIDPPGHRIAYLQTRNRFTSPDPAIDAVICVLEGFNARGGVPESLVVAGLAHPSALVRMTAAQFIPRGPDGKALQEQVMADSDPAVRQWYQACCAPPQGNPKGGGPRLDGEPGESPMPTVGPPPGLGRPRPRSGRSAGGSP